MNICKSVIITAMIALGLLTLLVLPIGAAGAQSGYNPDFDVAEPWGQIDVTDIQTVADNWNTYGEYSDAHNHWGETWTGAGFGLFFNGNSALPLLRSNNAGSGAGLIGQSGAGNGVYGQSDSSNTDKAALYGYSSEQASGVYGESVYGYGVYGNGGDDTGDYGGYFVGHGGVYGEAEYSGEHGGHFVNADGIGVYGESGSTSAQRSYGVYGHATAASGDTSGVYGESASSNGQGVAGKATALSGNAVGVSGGAFAPNGAGGSFWNNGGGYALMASNSSPTTPTLYVQNTGGAFTYPALQVDGTATFKALTAVDITVSDDLAVNNDLTVSGDLIGGNHNHDDRYYTESEANTRFINDDSNEVENADIANGALSPAKIAGVAWTADNDGPGSGLNADRLDGQHASAFAAASHDHWGQSWSGSGVGLTLNSSDSHGVSGSGGSGVGDYGGHFSGYGGVYANATDASGWALYAEGGAGAYSQNGFDTGGGDVAEYFPVRDADLEPGDVVVIDPGGASLLRRAGQAYATNVAGIVSTRPGIKLRTPVDTVTVKDEQGQDQQVRVVAAEGQALIALSGRVPCKVDASFGAIRPGDLLTTSPTPGHAMRAEPVEIDGVTFYRPGTVLGKALEALESGRGAIMVLVTLQ